MQNKSSLTIKSQAVRAKFAICMKIATKEKLTKVGFFWKNSIVWNALVEMLVGLHFARFLRR